jgi:hypothetical protein
MIDGVKTSQYSDAVFKFSTGTKGIVGPNGNVYVTGGGFSSTWGTALAGGWKKQSSSPGANWSELYKATVGKK